MLFKQYPLSSLHLDLDEFEDCIQSNEELICSMESKNSPNETITEDLNNFEQLKF